MIWFEQFDIKTGGRYDAVDVTEEVEHVVRASGVRTGSALVFSPHTTCCVLLSARGPALVESLERTIASLAPETHYYAHDDLDIRTENLVDDEPANAPAHIAHVVIGKASEAIPVIDGRLTLGEDQRVLFIELDSSRERRYCIQVTGE